MTKSRCPVQRKETTISVVSQCRGNPRLHVVSESEPGVWQVLDRVFFTNAQCPVFKLDQAI